MQMQQMIENKRALLKEIQQTKSKLHHLPPLDGIRRERWDRQERIDNMRARYGADMEKWPGHIRADYHNFEATVERAVEEINTIKDKKAKIDLKLKDLQEQLDGLYQPIAIKDLLQLQTTFNELSQKIEHLEGVVDEERCNAEDGEGNNHTLAQLNKEKEDLLASVACGESSDEKRLAVISQEISKEEELHDNHVNALITSSQKIAGLRRKIEQVEQDLAVAKQNYLDGLAMFLNQELEKAGGEYVKAAGVLAGSYSKVIAVSTILEKSGAPKNVYGPYTRTFRIPSFLLDTCISHDLPNMPGMLFQYSGSDVQGKIDDEIERFGRLGIEIQDRVIAPL
ncbi:MAG: hypothetical protein PHI97_32470 [Desulfobulbus sp.]|nr:hypothetical protein [Desulfobulbus sp.]